MPGLLEPKLPLKSMRKRSASRIETSEGGSVTMRGLHDKKRSRLAEEARVAAVAADKRDGREKAKQLRETEAAARLATWQLCKDACVCGKGPACDLVGLMLCTHCGDLKKHACRKQACLQALAPLALTFVPATPPAAAAATTHDATIMQE